MKRPGFSMVEILLAAMILSVGFIMLLPAFTVALNESRQSLESSIVVQLGQNAEAYLRASGVSGNGDSQRILDPWKGKDGNFTDGNVDGKLHPYEFREDPDQNKPKDAIPGFTTWRDRADGDVKTKRPAGWDEKWEWTDPNTNVEYKFDSKYERQNVRIYGDPASSKYYWAILYCFPKYDLVNEQKKYKRNQIELWIMVCKRQDLGDADGLGAGNMMRGLRNPTKVDMPGQVDAGVDHFDAGDSANFLDPGSGVVTNQGEILHIASRKSDGTIILQERVQTAFTSVYVVKYRDNAGAENACIGVMHTAVGY